MRRFSFTRMMMLCTAAVVCLALMYATPVMADTATTAPAEAATQPAAAPVALDKGDTAWLLTSSALVLLMTAPGLALFYGGLVRKKNVLSVLMQCMMIACLVSVQWVVCGYSLSFSPGNSFIGSFDWSFLNGVDHASAGGYAATIPHQAFMIFQMMFAIITPALIIGAFAERMRFGPFCIFVLLWSTLVYDPVAHWVWGAGGFLSGWGRDFSSTTGYALDFAGGTVVHINAGIAALATALFLGKRKGYPMKMSPPHNLPFAVIGAGLLWVGWFGFNAGSALAADKIATSAFVVTHTATAVAGLTWALMDWIFNKKPTVLGIITGAVGGLVAVTPASGFVNIIGAMGIGLGAGIIPWIMVSVVKAKLGYDDTLDAFGVHGIGGIWGAIATGIFATAGINSLGSGGWDGNWGQVMIQLKAVGCTIGYSLVMTLILLKVVDMVFKLRATEQEETVGLDLTQHKEAAYTTID